MRFDTVYNYLKCLFIWGIFVDGTFCELTIPAWRHTVWLNSEYGADIGTAVGREGGMFVCVSRLTYSLPACGRTSLQEDTRLSKYVTHESTVLNHGPRGLQTRSMTPCLGPLLTGQHPSEPPLPPCILECLSGWGGRDNVRYPKQLWSRMEWQYSEMGCVCAHVSIGALKTVWR